MRIVFAHRDLVQPRRGGICTIYQSISPILQDRGHEVFAVTATPATGSMLDAGGARAITVPRHLPLSEYRREVARAVLQAEPDVAECSTWEAELLSYLDIPSHAPVLVRGDLSAATMGQLDLPPDERTLLLRSDLNIAVSHYAKLDLERAYAGVEISDVVPNAVDRKLFRPVPEASFGQISSGVVLDLNAGRHVRGRDDMSTSATLARFAGADDRATILWVGRMTAMKGWDHLQYLVERLQDVAKFIVLLGRSPVLAPPDLRRPEEVLYLRDLSTSELPILYSAADYVLSTSRWEGFGLSLLEALACGATVLLPRWLDVGSELALHSETALIWDGVTDLARIIAAGQRTVGRVDSNISWERNALTTEAHYRLLRPDLE